ncbi:MAG: peptidoglycan DD-metalloendopeptidase family protein [Polyangiaceae bacterium]|nr:peptidoglycan DD-metalloendopeptidase family protein [Polyangiaceae bacterium]
MASEDELTVGSFQMPFPCGEVYSGQTRTNHSPLLAVDFSRANAFGDEVVAAAGGTVTRVENEGNTSYGRWVEIDHGSGYRTRYAHLSVQSVSIGQGVAQGQKVGELGSTGGSTGPHLHYELRHDGAPVKPVFNGQTATFYGTKSYTSKNKCSGGPSGVTGIVDTAGPDLTVRAEAKPDSDAVGAVSDGEAVTITCQKQGAPVNGTYGTSSLWDYIGNGYVADAYVSTGSDGQVAPTCE